MTASTIRGAEPSQPPARPISYESDFSSEIVHLFMDAGTGRYRKPDRAGLDQYFSRLQAHRVSRLIVWLTPFPLIADPAAYDAADWALYEAQARAIIESDVLSQAIASRKGFCTWDWLRQLLALRLDRDFGTLFTQSAAEHGIELTATFRPFETSLTKYYEVPAFDADGTYLWGFLPLATPRVNYHPEQVCFAHYRKVLSALNEGDRGSLGRIEIAGLADPEAAARDLQVDRSNLRLVAARFPPLDETSLVLVREDDGRFKLRKFAEIRDRALAHCRRLDEWKIGHVGDGSIAIEGFSLQDDERYLILATGKAGDPSIQSLDFDRHLPVELWSKANNRLGRVNMYWALDQAADPTNATRVAGISADAEYRSPFQATEASIAQALAKSGRQSLRDASLVVDLGDPWSVEMIDFQQPAAREQAVAEMKSLLALAPFDELFVSTRSHIQLSGFMADGDDGLRPAAEYRSQQMPYEHLGIDRAYAPRSVASDPRLVELARQRDSVSAITDWVPGEWDWRVWLSTCQRPDTPFAWRFARNVAVADGVRQLLVDFERELPGTRIRVILPPRAAAIAKIADGLDTLPRADGGVYGRGYYQNIWSSNNEIPAIGEGLALVDLTGLSVEPVLAGIRFLPDAEPLDLYLRHCLDDLKDNRGSSFRGPRSVFYEAQETLRMADTTAGRLQREQTICQLLANREEINEVILYEAADWTSYLPTDDPHAYLDGCR